MKVFKSKTLTTSFLSLFGLVLSSCGVFPESMFDEAETKVEFSFDVVKEISEKNSELNHNDSFDQPSYFLGPKSRLIFSLSHLSDHVDKIRTDGEHRVWAQVTLLNEADRPTALTAMRLCPISRKWMMLSNWSRAHPFGKKGKWKNQGGDYIEELCQNPLLVAPKSKTDSTDKMLYFDVTPWFQNFVQGRRENYGLILISTEEMGISGDLSSVSSPRIFWHQN
jgi:hypothetical protein